VIGECRSPNRKGQPEKARVVFIKQEPCGSGSPCRIAEEGNVMDLSTRKQARAYPPRSARGHSRAGAR
jgi:hypothetical protein